MQKLNNLIFVFSVSLFILSCSNNSAQKNTDKNQEVVNYGTVKIGNQIWMDKNLDVSKFRNGDEIWEAKTANLWYSKGVIEKEPAWCYYENKTANGTVYGKLYNYWAVIDPRGLAPEGWHIPTNNEWKLVINTLGGEGNAAQSMIGVASDWVVTDCIIENNSNSSGLNILPTGNRSECWTLEESEYQRINDGFAGLGKSANFWSVTNYDKFSTFGTRVGCSSSLSEMDNFKFVAMNSGYPLGEGISVRCVRD